MSVTRIANRYSKPLLDLAVEKQLLDDIYRDMLFLKKLCRESREFYLLLKSPIIKQDKKLKILESILDNRVEKLIIEFIRVLVRKGRETILPEIIDAFINAYYKCKGITPVYLTTAIQLDEQVKGEIIEKLKQIADLQQVELHESINPEIIGGFIIKFEDKLLDASVAHQLEKLKMTITQKAYLN